MTRLARRRRQSNEWTEEHVQTLLTGHDWFSAFTDGEPRTVPTRTREGWDERPEVVARLQAAVDELGESLLAEWIEDRPGSRPWFFWRFTAPDPRRCLTGPHRYTLPQYAEWPQRYFFGVPSIALPPDFGRSERYESELEYLARLDLLTPNELVANV